MLQRAQHLASPSVGAELSRARSHRREGLPLVAAAPSGGAGHGGGRGGPGAPPPFLGAAVVPPRGGVAWSPKRPVVVLPVVVLGAFNVCISLIPDGTRFLSLHMGSRN